jgi:hypothetical protein
MSAGCEHLPVEQPLFLLGAGCQKGGTSWLYDYLAHSPACAPGFAKEATIFDILDVPDHTWNRTKVLATAAQDLAKLERGEAADPRFLHRAAMLADTAIYYDYYTSLANRPGKRFTMDLTPNYALLPATRFRQIKEQFAARGVQTKVVMLLRDPVDRIWSQIRMHLRQRNLVQPDRPHPRTEAEIVLQRYARPTVDLRTRYERTLENLDQVFDPPEIHVELYERLFTASSVNKIAEFVGIDARTPNFDRKVNASSRQSIGLPEDVASVVAHHYRDTYSAVAERLGIANIGAWWPSAEFLA